MRACPLLLAGFLLVAGCASQGVSHMFRPAVYEVRPGDTLYSIAWRYGLDHRQLARWNDLDSPGHIQVGQELRLRPDADHTRTAQRTTANEAPSRRRDSGTSTQAPERRRSSSSSSSSSTSASGPESADKPSSGATGTSGGASDWDWPATGDLVGRFGDEGVAGRGIELAGEPGTPVKAAAAGEVVYSGEGLQAYGQLVIIRHGGDYLSAYAHNERLLVSEGQRVTAGQQIAEMGKTNDGRVLLHFEIRRKGSPVNPLDYLPARD